MTKDEAMNILRQFEALCIKYKLWFTVEMEKKPDTKMIRIREISIKIDQ